MYHRHRFDSVHEYLHHRAPACFIDAIVSIEETSIETTSDVHAGKGYIDGHFPGALILPGAMMQEMTTQTAGILIAANYNPMAEYDTSDPFVNTFALGVLVRVKRAKYAGFARPGDKLQIRVQLTESVGTLFDFTGQVICHGNVIMKNQFQLANIPSSQLQGK